MEVENIGAMVLHNIPHMQGGIGGTSYATNSALQRAAIGKVRPILEDALSQLYNARFPDCLKIADLGCSSGPNTLLIISEIIDIILKLCNQDDRKVPELQVSLNDLPGNDFNSIFRSLATFHDKLKEEKGDKLGPCFISGLPGSFYGRLFPRNSLHLVHSAYSLHWLSQVPEGLEKNKGNVYIARNDPDSDVVEAYLKQFQMDLSAFLSSRSEEMVAGGRMVLTICGRRSTIVDPTAKDACFLWELLSKSLIQMVSERLVGEDDVDSFNVPWYAAHKSEVEAIIQKEGSFHLDGLQAFESNWDQDDDGSDQYLEFEKRKSSKNIANFIRAVLGPLMSSHFGDSIIDDLFERYAKIVAEHLSVDRIKHFSLTVSLTKK